jgi:beta-1,4-mannosyl-glycoprotein beta-1,4-N-acetylglucosaminyltransferase
VSRIFDCFIFRDEFDALEIRLNELEAIVDCFVLCEATRTFTNQPKPLHFQDQKDRFARFQPKIKHVIVDDFPSETASESDLEHFQLNALERGLTDCAPDDIVIVSNVDEVPNPEAIRMFEGPISGLRMRLFGYYLNLENVAAPNDRKVRGAMCRYVYLRGPQWLRDFAHANHVSNKVVEDGGWRFAHLSDVDWISGKLSSQAQHDRSDPELIRANIEAGAMTSSQDDFWAGACRRQLPGSPSGERGKVPATSREPGHSYRSAVDTSIATVLRA